jgi:SAM-dependent methyltransferase
MNRVKSNDFHDYVIRDGRLIGSFDEMYRDHADPWGCSDHVGSFDNDLFIAAVSRVTPEEATLLDIGCGLGSLSARIRREVGAIRNLQACDISCDAIAKADARWNSAASGSHIKFSVLDVRRTDAALPNDLDVVTMAQVIWYILPEFADVLCKLRVALKPGGHLVILQSFLPAERQKYGREYMTGPEDLLAIVRRTGFIPVAEASIGLKPPNNLLLVARNER